MIKQSSPTRVIIPPPAMPPMNSCKLANLFRFPIFVSDGSPSYFGSADASPIEQENVSLTSIDVFPSITHAIRV